MRIVRFEAIDGTRPVRFGELDGQTIHELDEAPYAGGKRTGRRYERQAVRLRTPVVPSKIIGIGLNYRDHAVEHHVELPPVPLMFFKAPSALIGPEEDILLPQGVGRIDLEGELVVVLGRRARRIPADKAVNYILGYTCGNDVSARDVQKQDRMWPARSKSFDAFAPVGPWIETGVNPEKLRLRTLVNGQVRQDCSTAEMVFNVFEVVSFLSHVLTLEPGDCIFTGTPSGVSEIQPGDRVEIEIEGIGTLVNPVRAATA
jgi:2-keto-4-pentenoate hydratase/2-oxohepta-3-ene-1,7-dioic acid hydratase in catechol pathway